MMLKKLEFDKGDELDVFLGRLRKGGTGGNKQSKDWTNNPEPYNLIIDDRVIFQDNPIRLHSERNGRKKSSGYFAEPQRM